MGLFRKKQKPVEDIPQQQQGFGQMNPGDMSHMASTDHDASGMPQAPGAEQLGQEFMQTPETEQESMPSSEPSMPGEEASIEAPGTAVGEAYSISPGEPAKREMPAAVPAGAGMEDEVDDELEAEETEEEVAVTDESDPASADEPVEDDWLGDYEGQLTIDVYQTDDDIVVKSTIAGVSPENLDVTINNDLLTIKGERQQTREVKEEDYFYQECYWGSFSRSIILPMDVHTEKIAAELENGILTITLPKANKEKTRRIDVRAA